MAILHPLSELAFGDTGTSPVIGVSDLDLIYHNGQWQLFATDRVQGAVTNYRVMGSGTPGQIVDLQPIAGGSVPATGLEFVGAGPDLFAVMTGPSHFGFAAYQISDGGRFETSVSLQPASGLNTAILSTDTFAINGQDYLLTTQMGQQGFSVHALSDDLGISHVQSLSTDSSVSSIATASVGGTGIVVTAEAGSDAVVSYLASGNGALTKASTIGADDGLGINQPSMLEVVTTGGETFAIVAAQKSSSISILKLGPDGSLTATDHVFDERGTRFSQIAELSTVSADGRVLVLAAGDDDGISLLELLPGGTLLHHTSMADSETLPLAKVSALSGAVEDGVLYVYAASGSETGIAEITFDVGPMGQTEAGSAVDDTLTGADMNDVLYGGSGGQDDLFGQGGDDILVAGSENDQLSGGAGADLFVFGNSEDGSILDFDPAEDWIDLSGWPMLYDVSQLTFSEKGSRLDISLGTRKIKVNSVDGSNLDAADVTAHIKIDLSHTLILSEPVDPNQTYMHYGTSGDDDLVGDVGLDVFVASAGSDRYSGGQNQDTVSYQEFSQKIKTDLLFPDKSDAETGDDTLDSIEELIATPYNDLLLGDHDQNWFYGGSGDDDLRGRSARDRLYGGEGDDKLNGGKGKDRLEGGDGNDLLDGTFDRDFLKGGRGDDTLLGGGAR